ncbi:MAG: DnaJ domain-containing protein [Succinivibrio sp.]
MYLLTGHILLVLFGPLLGFFGYDFPEYRKALRIIKAKRAEEEEKKRQELEALQAKEQRKVIRQIKAVQKKNREDKASLYENIYTVAGYILATQPNIKDYEGNAEDVIRYFKATEQERLIAVEAFNRALDRNFDVEKYVVTYMTNIGKNRDYINYVLTYAFIIATLNDNIHYEAKERLVEIGKSLGSSVAALKRLFKSKGAEARFAREFDSEKKQASDTTTVSRFSGADSSGSENGGTDSQNSSSNRRSSGSYSSSGTDKVSEALDILGLDLNATFDDVKKAHKRLMLRYHPDRLASQGLPEDMIAIYTEKAKAVQVAFDLLKKMYGDYI